MGGAVTLAAVVGFAVFRPASTPAPTGSAPTPRRSGTPPGSNGARPPLEKGGWGDLGKSPLAPLWQRGETQTGRWGGAEWNLWFQV